MISFDRYSSRSLIAHVHDMVMCLLAFYFSFVIRTGDLYSLTDDMILYGVLIFLVLSFFIFNMFGLYKGIWRYSSILDLVAITKGVTLVLAIGYLLLFLLIRLEDIPRSVPIINWFVLMAFLGGPRFIYRLVKDRHFSVQDLSPKIPVLIMGAGDRTELFLRSIMRNSDYPYDPVAIISEHTSRVGRNIQTVPIVSHFEAFEEYLKSAECAELAPRKIILSKDDWPGERVRKLLEICETNGLTLSRLPKMTDLQSGVAERIDVRPIALEDLLGRPQKALDKSLPEQIVKNKKVLVTGAGGSIGSELVRQICSYGPSEIVLLDASEFALYTIDLEISKDYEKLPRQSVLCNIRDLDTLERIFEENKFDITFHAAALKHVPLVEHNPFEGLLTNVGGTKNVADCCLKFDVKTMVLISTDKAVNPTNIMGTTKRIAEIYAQTLDLLQNDQESCNFITVRFGNVLGSNGSVVPLFQKQLAEGGPITVTDPEMTRYFMTIREAVELVLQSSVMATNTKDLTGKICVLDMGEPVKITHLAEQIIRLAGLEPHQDIKIEFTGLRPGEKLFEEIFHGDEPLMKSDLDGVFIASPRTHELEVIKDVIEQILSASKVADKSEVIENIKKLVPEYQNSQDT